MKNRPSARAFTLVETLVVLTIVALLAAILFPVLAQGRLAGQRAACLSNTKQWSLSFQLYVDDNDGGYPLWGYTDLLRGPNDEGLHSIWFNSVMVYAASFLIMTSPGDPTRQFSRHPALWRGQRIERPRLSYPMNDILGGGGFRNGTVFWEPAQQQEFVAPAETIVVAAGKINGNVRNPNGGSAGFGERFGWLLAGVPARTDVPPEVLADGKHAPFFRQGTNFAFADGHARFVTTAIHGRSLLNSTLPWERHVLPNQDCASWRIPSDFPQPGISPRRCQWW